MKDLIMFLPRFLTSVCLGLTVSAQMALSHELWLEPQQYQVDNGAQLVVNIKNGEDFAGNTLSYFDRSSTRFELGLNGDTQEIVARAGDRPALTLDETPDDTLVAVLHETTPSTITYKTWAKFAKFATHKDFPQAEADHSAAGWPRDGFRERYTRHVKTLIAVGDGAGQDAQYGLETEITALTNPYDPDFDGAMQIALTYQGQPRADAQIEVFDRAPDDSVTVSLHRTDAKGIARIPVTPGHDYLFDAVVLRPAPDAGETEKSPVWETLWAALSFHVPG